MLMSSTSYAITLQVTNFLDGDSILSANVLVSDPQFPTAQVRIISQNSVIYRWKPLQMFVQVSLPGCAFNGSTSGNRFELIIFLYLFPRLLLYFSLPYLLFRCVDHLVSL